MSNTIEKIDDQIYYTTGHIRRLSSLKRDGRDRAEDAQECAEHVKKLAGLVSELYGIKDASDEHRHEAL